MRSGTRSFTTYTSEKGLGGEGKAYRSEDTLLRLRTVGERVDLAVLGGIAVDSAQAGKRVLPVNVHGAGSADALSTAPSEGQGGIDLVLDLDQSVQNLK